MTWTRLKLAAWHSPAVHHIAWRCGIVAGECATLPIEERPEIVSGLTQAPIKKRARRRVFYRRGAGLLCHDAHHLQTLVGVTPFVVVPGDDLHEGAVQCDAGVGVKDGGAGVAAEVGGNHLVFGVTKDAL